MNNNKIIQVKKSKLNGFGVFSKVYIPKGGRIGRWVGQKVEKTRSKYAIYLEFNGKDRIYLGSGLLKYLNHSDLPNSNFKGFELFATEPIEKGQEITIYYGDDYVWKDNQKKS